jgi:hypothetical protein
MVRTGYRYRIKYASREQALILRSYVGLNGGRRRLYQEGSVATIRPLPELYRLYRKEERLPEGTAMFCGTLAVPGGIPPSEEFEMELDDPVLGRKSTHSYRVHVLPHRG